MHLSLDSGTNIASRETAILMSLTVDTSLLCKTITNSGENEKEKGFIKTLR